MPDVDQPAAILAEAKRITDGLQFACRLPDKTPGLTACGGPAAEAYWDYFTPARISSLLAAVKAVLKLADELGHLGTTPPSGKEDEAAALGIRWVAAKVREAITAVLAGEEAGGALETP